MITHCVYHKADLDGKCSAAIVLKLYPDVTLHGIDYGEPFPWEKFKKHDKVFMVDFSLPWDQMLRLHDHVNLVWIDHHESSLDACAAHQAANTDFHITGKRKIGIGACQLVWKYLFPAEPTPRAVQLLAQFDVWEHSDPDVLPFQFGMLLEDIEPRSRVWQRLLHSAKGGFDFAGAEMEGLLSRGEGAHTYHKTDNAKKAESLWFPTTVIAVGGGVEIPVMAINAGPHANMMFDSIWDPEKFHAKCAFYWNPGIGKWSVRLYTTRDDVNCAKISSYFGGGGHAKAAGFECTRLPFQLKRRDA